MLKTSFEIPFEILEKFGFVQMKNARSPHFRRKLLLPNGKESTLTLDGLADLTEEKIMIFIESALRHGKGDDFFYHGWHNI